MEILLELIGELVIQLVIELLADGGCHLIGRTKKRKQRKVAGPVGRAAPVALAGRHLLLGAICGALSLLLFRESFIGSGPFKVINLVITPVVAGYLMALIGRWRTRRGKQTLPLEQFLSGFAFAFALALVRFIWAA